MAASWAIMRYQRVRIAQHCRCAERIAGLRDPVLGESVGQRSLAGVRVNDCESAQSAVPSDEVNDAPCCDIVQPQSGHLVLGRLQVHRCAEAAAGINEEGRAFSRRFGDVGAFLFM